MNKSVISERSNGLGSDRKVLNFKESSNGTNLRSNGSRTQRANESSILKSDNTFTNAFPQSDRKIATNKGSFLTDISKMSGGKRKSPVRSSTFKGSEPSEVYADKIASPQPKSA